MKLVLKVGLDQTCRHYCGSAGVTCNLRIAARGLLSFTSAAFYVSVRSVLLQPSLACRLCDVGHSAEAFGDVPSSGLGILRRLP
jgi:hypothetical protein